MKRSEELRHLLRQRPFQPFRVHLTNGKVLDVVCPEISLIGEDLLNEIQGWNRTPLPTAW
jgi:hypothetical protein